jgi:hypothetical protein
MSSSSARSSSLTTRLLSRTGSRAADRVWSLPAETAERQYDDVKHDRRVDPNIN